MSQPNAHGLPRYFGRMKKDVFSITRRAVLNRQVSRNLVEGLKMFRETSRNQTLASEEYLKIVRPLLSPYPVSRAVGL